MILIRIKWDITAELSPMNLWSQCGGQFHSHMRLQVLRRSADGRQNLGWDIGAFEFVEAPGPSWMTTASTASLTLAHLAFQLSFPCYPGYVNLRNTLLSGLSWQIRLASNLQLSLCCTTDSAGISMKINCWKSMANHPELIKTNL